jgi:hypothetical protein
MVAQQRLDSVRNDADHRYVAVPAMVGEARTTHGEAGTGWGWGDEQTREWCTQSELPRVAVHVLISRQATRGRHTLTDCRKEQARVT